MAYDGPGGAIFKNNKKQNERHPDLTGFVELNEECVASIKDQIERGIRFPKIELSAWTKTSAKGNRFMSLSAKKPFEPNGGGSQRGSSSQSSSGGWAASNESIDDDIPF